jgi:hypothetical protein
MKHKFKIAITMLLALLAIYSVWLIPNTIFTRKEWDLDCNKFLSQQDRREDYNFCLESNLDFQRRGVRNGVIGVTIYGGIALLLAISFLRKK